MNLDKQNMKNIRLLILFAAVVCLGVINIKEVGAIISFVIGIVSPFIWGGAIAFVMNIPLKGIERRLLGKWKGKMAERFKRTVSILLSYVLIIFIITFVFMTVVPQLGKTIMEIGNKLPAFFNRVYADLENIFAENPQIIEYLNNLQPEKFDWKSILNSVIAFLQNGFGNMLTSTVSVASSIIGGVTNVVIALIFSFYVLAQKEKLANQGDRILKAYCAEKVYVYVRKVIGILSNNFSSFISGQCLEAVLLGSMFIIVLTLFQIPYALLIGVLIAFTALIPVVGAFIGCAVGAFLILVDSPMKALVFIIIFLILQQIEGNLIYPHVVGSSVGLPSIWVLAAVTVGGSLMGVMGMLMFIPLVSTVYILLRDDVNARNAKKKCNARSEQARITQGAKSVQTVQEAETVQTKQVEQAQDVQNAEEAQGAGNVQPVQTVSQKSKGSQSSQSKRNRQGKKKK